MSRTDAHRPFKVAYPNGWDPNNYQEPFPYEMFSRPRAISCECRERRRRDRHNARNNIRHGMWDALATREQQDPLYYW